MVSSSSFVPEFKADKIEPDLAPRFVVGAASPLWLMFGGAAAAGAAYWWWASRWREAVNLEAVLALTPEPVAPAAEAEETLLTTPEPVAEAVAEAVETAEVLLDAVEETVDTMAEASNALIEAANDATLNVVDVTAEAVVELEAEAEPPISEALAAEAPPAEPLAAESAPDATLAEMEAVSEALVAGADDLTRLVGVGPKLAASLAELGVTTFGQIAAWTPEELADIDLKLGLKGRAERDAWIAQAKRFAAAVEAAAV
ncbi:phasin PhaH [Caulobacter segnis]|uniref:phasin PhaH n=1 Tax=Caulobacter segnis TaxID=88688 RepID=UPI002864C42F|nr:phasin PhaH [Caulobacter segnis]MDR6627885.1 putative flap endonuclease-1-like 5' DNA nuclease [Caulobacter segnis]